jgi:hypothetical protein
VNAVLFFDEADAIFGKRSDVSAPSPSVQRDAAEEEPPVQGMFVQRQDEEEEPVQGLFVQREGEEEKEEETPA